MEYWECVCVLHACVLDTTKKKVALPATHKAHTTAAGKCSKLQLFV